MPHEQRTLKIKYNKMHHNTSTWCLVEDERCFYSISLNKAQEKIIPSA